MSTDSETFVNVRLRLRGPRWTEVLMMTLMEMFNLCDTCIYAPCLCGNEPENCIEYIMCHGVNMNGGADHEAD